MYDVIVIGGGIVGASAAYHLAQTGADVLLADREDEGRATDAGAGIVAPILSTHHAGPQERFAMRAGAYYPDLVAEIEALTGLDTGFRRVGTLVGAFDKDEIDAYERLHESAKACRDRDDGAGSELAEVSADRATRLFPPLAEPLRAFYYQAGARVDGRQMTAALHAASDDEGAERADIEVESIETEHGAVTGVIADGDFLAAESIVVAGGAWSPAFGDDLGVSVPVEPQRGQIAHIEVDADTAEWPIVKGFHGHYIVPWSDGRIAAGATRETGSGFDPRTTADGVRTVLSEALRVAPGLADASLTEVRVGLRPVSDDGRAIIGQAGPTGAFLATGHGPTGLTLGPYTGKVVADAIVEGSTPIDLTPYSPDRFE